MDTGGGDCGGSFDGGSAHASADGASCHVTTSGGGGGGVASLGGHVTDSGAVSFSTDNVVAGNASYAQERAEAIWLNNGRERERIRRERELGRFTDREKKTSHDGWKIALIVTVAIILSLLISLVLGATISHATEPNKLHADLNPDGTVTFSIGEERTTVTHETATRLQEWLDKKGYHGREHVVTIPTPEEKPTTPQAPEVVKLPEVVKPTQPESCGFGKFLAGKC